MFLVFLKVLLFAIILIAPIVIGRELFQAARGKSATPVVQEVPATEEV